MSNVQERCKLFALGPVEVVDDALANEREGMTLSGVQV